MDSYLAPEHERSALITIDVQRDTLDGAALEIAGTSATLPNMGQFMEAASRSANPIWSRCI